MIIAEIGSMKCTLEKIEDAETLLRILSRAQTVEESYDFPWDGDRWYKDNHGTRISIKIVEGNLLGYEEAQEAINAALEKKRQERPEGLHVAP